MSRTDAEYLAYDPFDGDRDVDVRCSTVKIVKVRTRQWCMGNGSTERHPIKLGARARNERAIFEGQWASYYVCLDCMDKWLDEFAPVVTFCPACKGEGQWNECTGNGSPDGGAEYATVACEACGGTGEVDLPERCCGTCQHWERPGVPPGVCGCPSSIFDALDYYPWCDSTDGKDCPEWKAKP